MQNVEESLIKMKRFHTVAKCQWQTLMLSEEKQIRLKMYAHLVPTSDGRFKKDKKNKHVPEILVLR